MERKLSRLPKTFKSAATSRSPRLSPWPAKGWITCAASPSRTTFGSDAGPIKRSERILRKGKLVA